jgi:hypothetical protein
MWTKILRAFERQLAGRHHRKQTASTVTPNRTKGLFQIRRDEGVWICSPVIYGSGATFLPLPMSTRRLVDLFTLCRLPLASLTEDCFILEFLDDISVEQLQQFGFTCAELVVV